jgi:hypothetical protein
MKISTIRKPLLTKQNRAKSEDEPNGAIRQEHEITRAKHRWENIVCPNHYTIEHDAPMPNAFEKKELRNPLVVK